MTINVRRSKICFKLLICINLHQTVNMYKSLFTAGTATHTCMHMVSQWTRWDQNWAEVGKLPLKCLQTGVAFLHHSTANRWWWCCHVDDDVSWERSHVIASETWCLSSSSTVAHRAEDLGKTSRWLTFLIFVAMVKLPIDTFSLNIAVLSYFIHLLTVWFITTERWDDSAL